MVRAKFQCNSMKKYVGYVSKPGSNKSEQGFLYEYEFYAVTSGGNENESFFASTPSGQLKMSCIRDNLFIPGKTYYLDFPEAT